MTWQVMLAHLAESKAGWYSMVAPPRWQSVRHQRCLHIEGLGRLWNAHGSHAWNLTGSETAAAKAATTGGLHRNTTCQQARWARQPGCLPSDRHPQTGLPLLLPTGCWRCGARATSSAPPRKFSLQLVSSNRAVERKLGPWLDDVIYPGAAEAHGASSVQVNPC